MFQESGNYDNIQFRVFRFTSLKPRAHILNGLMKRLRNPKQF